MSLRARIATIVASTVAVAVILTGVGVQALAVQTLMRTIDDDLRNLATLIDSDPRGLLVVTGPGRGRLGGAAGIVQIINRDGVIQQLRGPLSAQSSDVKLPIDDAVREIALSGATSLRTVTVDDTRLRMLIVPLNENFAVQVARPLNEVDQVQASLRQRTLVASLIAALFAAIAAWFIAGRSIRPVTALTHTVENVRSAGDTSHSTHLRDIQRNRYDEVARLAQAFEAMLTRLDASTRAQERLAADAAHELKTPLTSLRTNIEVLAENRDTLSHDMFAGLTGDVLGQLAELDQMVDGLLALARLDTSASETQPFSLRHTVHDVTDAALRRYPNRADDLTVTLPDTPVTINGDPRTVALAVSALIDNAVKYAPTGPITVTLDAGHDTATVRVCDTGPGVTDAEINHLFERFYRSAHARSQPGAGLGLALVQRVAQAHDGAVFAAHNTPNGLCVAFRVTTL